MTATSGFLTALECTKFVFGRGSAQDPAGELTALPRPPSWFKGDLLLRGRGHGEGLGKGEKEKGRRKEGKREGRGKEGEGFSPPPPSQIPGSAPVRGSP